MYDKISLNIPNLTINPKSSSGFKNMISKGKTDGKVSPRFINMIQESHHL